MDNEVPDAGPPFGPPAPGPAPGRDIRGAAMTTSAAFWDRIAERYARRPVRDVEAYDRTLARTRSHLAPGDAVLEIGCGTGTTALKLAGAVGEITASDISGRMIEIARGRAAEAGAGNVSFLHAPLDGPEIGGRRYDAVLAFNLLHLADDLPGAFGRIRGLVQPGGLFISKTPCLKDARLWMRALIPVLRRLGMAPFVRSVTVAELDAAIEAAGFRIVETGVFPASPPARFVVARRA